MEAGFIPAEVIQEREAEATSFMTYNLRSHKLSFLQSLTGNTCQPCCREEPIVIPSWIAQVAIVKEMTGRNRAAQLEIVKQMSRQ